MLTPVQLKHGRKVVATIEARMTSSRLPGKVLKKACGKPMLELMIERVRRIEYVDELVVATTVNSTDDPIVELANRLHVTVFRGSEDDVLGRLFGAATSADADVIVELTGDCPLIDPDLATQVIEFYLLHENDYVSNDHLPTELGFDYDTYPWGMDTQVFSIDVLKRAEAESHQPEEREHPTRRIIRSPEFSKALVPATPDTRRPDIRLTLDTAADFELIKQVFEGLYPTNPDFGIRDMIEFVDNLDRKSLSAAT